MEQDNNWYQLGYGGFANVYGSDYEIYAKKQLKNDMRNKKIFLDLKENMI
ncbi:hypothetical protein OBG91_15325 [Lactococcus lactis]|nr:hypothetical protein [Lactococcus lactis]